MVDTFGGVSFQLLIQGHQEGGDSLLEVAHVPYSNDVVVDLGGQLETWLDCDVKFANEAAFTSLLALRNTLGTLAYRTTTRSAILKSLFRTQWLPGGNRIARARWLLL